MKTKPLLFAAIFGGLCFGPPAFCADPPSAALLDNPAAKAKEDALYSEGTRAINDAHWAQAEAIFDNIVQLHGQRAEAALYWKAYAESKEGDRTRALASCSELRQAYPHGQWINECGALEIEMRGKSDDPLPPQAEQDEELKLLALNSLMAQDESRALPVIAQILTSNKPEKLKARALFILAQDQSQPAQTLLGQLARGENDAALQAMAVEMLAITRGKQSAGTLADIYRQTANEQAKKAILHAYLVIGSPDPLVEAARHESNAELVRAAVRTLGAMGAVPQLLALYHDSSSSETKADILKSLVASGPRGADALTTIAGSEQDPALRSRAIRNLAAEGGMAAAPSLVEMYKKNSDLETKRAAVQALFVLGDSHDLIDLARAEKDPHLQQTIVQRLSVMHNKEATDYMLEILNR